MAAASPLVFVSAFAPGEQGGIHAYEFSTDDGRLKPLQRTAADNPFFLAVAPNHKYLYATDAMGGKGPGRKKGQRELLKASETYMVSDPPNKCRSGPTARFTFSHGSAPSSA